MTKYRVGVLIVGLIVLGKASGLIKDILLTYYHGVSLVTDAFFLAASISSLLYAAVYSSIPALVIPLFSRLGAGASKSNSDRVLSSVLTFYLIVSVFFTLFTLKAAPVLVEIFASSMAGDVKRLATDYLSIMSLTFILSPVVGFYNAIQVVNKSVIFSYLAPIVNNAFFCLGLVLFSSLIDFYKVLILGIVAWLVLIFVNYREVQITFSFKRPSYTELINNKIFSIVFPAALAFYIEQFNSFVAIYFAAQLDFGSVSILSYANKLNLVLLSVFVVILTTFIFPRIAEDMDNMEGEELAESILRYLRPIIVFGFPIVFLMSFYSINIVSLLFQRGSFGSADVESVSKIFSIAVLGLFFCLIRDVMNRVYFADKNSATPMALSLVSLFINFLLCFNLYQQFALAGLALAGVGSIFLNCLLLLLLGQQRFKCNLLQPLFFRLIVCLFGLILASPFLYWSNNLYSQYWIILSIVFFCIYLLFLYWFRVGEVLFTFAYLSKQYRRLQEKVVHKR